MKAMQIIYFMFLFNAFLFIFTSLGVYSMAINAPSTWVDVGESLDLAATILRIGGIGSLTAIGVGVAAHYLAGTTGLQSMSLGILMGFFTGLFYNTFSVLQSISTYLGEFGFVLNTFFVLIGTVFIITIINAVRQMGTGGDRAYE